MIMTSKPQKSIMRKPAKDRWSKGPYKKMIIDQRKFMWEPEYVALIAKWVGFKPGQTVVDVGCGLGYLGTLYWPFFGRGGKYCGVDVSPKLVAQAKKLSQSWAKGGKTEFKVGDAYKLPYPDKFADVVMCQTLLMHLSDPQKAVNEMYRLLKPGGVVLCKEPDNLSWSLQHSLTSLPELPIEDELFFRKIDFIYTKGRANLGQGFFNAAPRVPLWLKAAGFSQIDAKNASQASLGVPPYETPRQKHEIAERKESIRRSKDPSYKKQVKEHFRKTFFAGGGTKSDYDKYLKLRKKHRPRKKLYEQQIKNGSYYWFNARQLFAIIGHKPR